MLKINTCIERGLGGGGFNSPLYLIYNQIPASPFHTQATSLGIQLAGKKGEENKVILDLAGGWE